MFKKNNKLQNTTHITIEEYENMFNNNTIKETNRWINGTSKTFPHKVFVSKIIIIKGDLKKHSWKSNMIIGNFHYQEDNNDIQYDNTGCDLLELTDKNKVLSRNEHYYCTDKNCHDRKIVIIQLSQNKELLINDDYHALQEVYGDMINAKTMTTLLDASHKLDPYSNANIYEVNDKITNVDTGQCISYE